MMDIFVIRTDVFPYQIPTPTESKKVKYSWSKTKLTVETVVEHLKGVRTIGTPQLSTDGNVKFICFDCDKVDTDSVRTLHTLALEAFSRESVLLENSGTEGRYHVWVFFSFPISAKAAQKLGKEVVKAAQLKSLIELFPKQVKVTKYGNFVKLPLGYHHKTGNYSYFCDENFKKIPPEEGLMNIEPFDSDTAIEMAESLDSTSTKQPSSTKRKRRITNYPCIDKILEGPIRKENPSRHDAAIIMAAYYRNVVLLDRQTTLALLEEWNAKAVDPPLEKSELASTLSSAERGQYEFTCQSDYLKPYCIGRGECRARMEPMPDIDESITTIDKVKEIFEDNYKNLWEEMEVGVCTAATLFLNNINKPICMIFVGPSGSGKSIIVEALPPKSPISLRVDDITAASFISQSKDVKDKNDLSGIDFLPKMDGRATCFSDMSPVVGDEPTKVKKAVGVLTRILDGRGYARTGAVHGMRSFIKDMRFAILGASVPFEYSVWKIMGNMGPRLYFCQMPFKKYSNDFVISTLTGKTQRNRQKEVMNAVYSFLMNLKNRYPDGYEWDTEKDAEKHYDILNIIVSLGRIVALLRAQLRMWETHSRGDEGDGYQYRKPVKETPMKPSEALYALAQAHAFIHGRSEISEADLPMCAKIAVSSCSDDRAMLFRAILANEGSITTNELSIMLNLHIKTAYRVIKELTILGILDDKGSMRSERAGHPSTVYELAEEFKWLLEPRWNELKIKMLAGWKREEIKEESDVKDKKHGLEDWPSYEPA